MADAKSKDNVYIDVDDEITTIIDKVQASESGIVALVLPKRATVLQSVVNMKLLKRSADEENKRVVLITSETSLLPLAGSAGMYVAKDLQSKPEIPSAPDEESDNLGNDDALELDDEPEEEPQTVESAGDKPVGELAGSGVANEQELAEEQDKRKSGAVVGAAAGAAVAGKSAKAASKKNRKLKVPNFNKFRLRLVLAGLGLLLLVVLLYWLLAVMPKATIAVTTDGRAVNSSMDVTLDSEANEVDPSSGTVPASKVSEEKTNSEQVDATGKENRGNRASGSVTMSGCDQMPIESVPAGTGVSTNGNTYITQEDATFQTTDYDYSNGCWNQQSNSVDITAQHPGEEYNTSSGTDFSVAGRPDVDATGSADGGTDDIRQVVTQADIDNAKGKLDAEDNEIQAILTDRLKQSNLLPISATFNASDPEITTSADPGEEASTVTVTQTTTYSMYGTNRNNLVTLIKQDINGQVNLDQQVVLDDGLGNASFSLQDQTDTTAVIAMESTARVGPDINLDGLKQELAGQKPGFARDRIQQIPGVTDVQVDLSPFWLSSIPGNTDKIIIEIKGEGGGS